MITRKASLKIQVYILTYVGKVELRLKWPVFWRDVKDGFDSAFAEHVSINAPSASIRAQYTDGLQHAFGPLISYDHLRLVEVAVAEKRELPVESLRAILATKVGALLYRGDGAQDAIQNGHPHHRGQIVPAGGLGLCA